jgi:D-3-phosphoglycerate dehydrogenase
MVGMSMKRVLLGPSPLSRVRDWAVKRLVEAGLHPLYVCKKDPSNDPEFWRHLERAEVLILGIEPKVDDAFLERAPCLKHIAIVGVGLDNVDLPSATRRGVVVFYNPGSNTESVADHTFALMLCLARKICVSDKMLREGRWQRLMGLSIWQKNLGLIGMGSIGQAVVARSKGFGMHCAAFDKGWNEDFAAKHSVMRMDLDRLLTWADILTVHCPLTPETKGLIGMRELKLMKPSALLINTARGGIVQEDDLIHALSEGIIAGAGLDVFESEPPPAGSILLKMDNVVLTPHVGWLTQEGLNEMNQRIIDQVIAVSQGERPAHVANPGVLVKA